MNLSKTLHRSLLLLLIVLVFCVNSPGLALAMSSKQKATFTAGINYFDVETSCDSSPGAGAAVTPGVTNPSLIVIDPGHSENTDENGRDGITGLYNFDYKNVPEMGDAYTASQKIKTRLTAKGYQVVVTKSSAADKLNLSERAERANNTNGALLFTMHSNILNGNPSSGVNVLMYPDANSKRSPLNDSRKDGKTGLVHPEIMAKSKEYAEKMAPIINQKINKGYVAKSFKDQYGDNGLQGNGKNTGNTPVQTILTSIPSVYSEVSQADLPTDKFADVATDAISQAIPLPAGGAAPATNTDTTATESCCDGESGGGSATATGDNPKDIYAALVGKGLTPIQAAGIMGNMSHESGFEPRKVEGGALSDTPTGSGGYGLVQWTPSSKLTDILGERELNISGKPGELIPQIEALWAQLDGKSKTHPETQAGKDIKGATTIEDAVRAFQGDLKIGGHYAGYERPGSESDSLADRIGVARGVLRQYGGSAVSGGPASSGCAGAGGGAIVGDLAGTVKNYAWPTYHSAPYTKLKPGYAAAVRKAQQEGRYVGGASKPGVDCGGFVTTLMIDSGFEPAYNSSGKGGNTISQEAWMIAHWQKIIPNGTKDLQPGDVAINDHHTYAYVGTIEGFNSVIASASFSTSGQSWRSPMAGHETPADSSFNWYRKK